MGKLIYPLNGINYILFEIELPLKLVKNFECRIKLLDGIIRHSKYIENIWSQKNISIKCLIPEANMIKFNNPHS